LAQTGPGGAILSPETRVRIPVAVFRPPSVVGSMSSDLIAWIVAISLGIAVVVLGLRRNLSQATRNGLPRFGGGERATPTLGLYIGAERRRRPLSSQHRRWLVAFYVLIAFTDTAFAVLSADNRLLHASTAGLFALGAVFLLRQGSSHPSHGSDS
jgi:hypothetical protein